MASKVYCRSQLPQVNVFDIPELMRGAQSSSTPAARLEFEQRCRELHSEDMESHSASLAGTAAVTASDVTVDELAAMFPSLDPTLVMTLASDAPTTQHAMETLLALTTALSEPAAPPMPPKDIGLDNIDAFPSLVDADGWEVASQHLFNRNPDEDLGSTWRDRAKVAACKPAPQTTTAAVVTRKHKKAASNAADATGPEVQHPENDYEFRQRLGKQRIQNRTRFSGIGRSLPVAVPVDSDCQLGEVSSQSYPSLSDEEV